MRVLVTGGAGYVGASLTTRLLEQRYKVIVFDNFSRGPKDVFSSLHDLSSLHLLHGDISKPDQLFNPLKSFEIDAVVHLAAIPGLTKCLQNPKEAILTNIYGTNNVLELCRRKDIKRIIFSSSGAVYGAPTEFPILEEHPIQPTNLYGVTKQTGEALLMAYHETYNLNTITLRFGNIYGVGKFTYWETVIPRFIRLAYQRSPLTIYGDGTQSRDFIHISDIVHAILLSLEIDTVKIKGQAINISSGQAVSINEVAHKVATYTASRLKHQLNIVNLPSRTGESTHPNYCYDTTRSQHLLQFESKWTIDQGIEQLFQYLELVYTLNQCSA